MATPREIRRLAFQVLFQLDARGGGDAQSVLESLEHSEEYTPAERRKAFVLASEAFAARQTADEEMTRLAPAWPVHRQAAVDRAILRLAYFEMISGRTHPRIAVNEAVELAKEFSTDRSPAFVNGLLDKVLKQVLLARGEAPDAAVPGAGGGAQVPEIRTLAQPDAPTPPPAS